MKGTKMNMKMYQKSTIKYCVPIILLFLTLTPFLAAEVENICTIFTVDGEVIQGKITEITEDAIWYEATIGDITEYVGIEKAEVIKILNADGSGYSYGKGN